MGYPRITYNSINVDFDKHFNGFDFWDDDQIFENESASGITERLHFYGREYIRANIERLGSGLIQELREWYRYVRDGSTFALYWDRDFGLYIPFEGKRLYTTDDLAGTFARSGTAYAVDYSTGLVTSYAENVPRYPEGKYGAGILIEGSSTNYLFPSVDMTHANYTAGFMNVTKETTEVLDPAGTNYANKLAATDTSATIYNDNTGETITTSDGCYSVWLRSLTDDLSASISLMSSTAGTLATESITVTSEWQRFSVAYNSVGNIGGDWGGVITLTGASDVVYAWGNQIEEGRRYPTGYIPTTVASAARNNETLYFDVTHGTEIDMMQGTISLWVKNPWAYNDNEDDRFFLHGVDSGGNNVFLFYKNTDGNLSTWIYRANRTNFNSVAASASSMTANTWHHICMTWDCTIDNGIKIYLDGSLLATDTNDPFTPATDIDKIYVGSTDTPSDYGDCVIDDLYIYKQVKNAEWVSMVYNSTHPIGARKNYWSALILEGASFHPVQLRGGNKYDFEFTAKENLT